ncbi:ABC transporter ATP-binding protein [Pseudoflavonifractor sp. An85]|uniref:ABC transporter ATP-binding protein n=1 Tax=Pseudoflavonifractor sp. An85 TaxID=1965661 RepID=UPI000B3878FA|nr:ABC transporter ATP-binding protein [Pseudoflavonifractor sp. An85]OUN25042.1 multidrug ABC transporter ATP-binding protein [Pseudoflavonifractor sp. An85]
MAGPMRHGPMGHGPAGMHGGDKAADFSGTMKKLLKYMNRYLPVLILSLVCAVAGTAFSILGPKILGNATTKLFEGLMAMIAGTGGIDFDALAQILLFLGGLYLFSALLTYVQGWLMAGIATKVSYTMRTDISRKIDRLPMSYFDKVSHGEVLSRITNDVDSVTQTLNQSLSQVVTQVTLLLGVLIMMLSISPWMTLIALCILPVCLFIVMNVIRRSQKFFRSQQEYLGHVNGHVEEMFGAHVVVTAFNGQEDSIRTFHEMNDKLYHSAWKSQFLSGMMMPLMNFASNLGYVAICVLGGFLALNQAITVGDIQAFIQYVRQFTQPINQLANISNQLQLTAAAAERVFLFLDEPEESPDPSPAVDPESVDGSVQFAHVNFGYVPDKTIIHDFSATIQPGTKVAIVGPTGAGKTTIVKLLMRFYDVNEGAVLLSGYDVRQFARGEMRDAFGMVLQDTWLYNDTIRENIRFGRLTATDEEVLQAAKAAQVDHFVRTLPHGYDTVLNEDASNISQGQKQLLTIARTILSDPKILILDEATSSVDTRTEVAIQQAMDHLTQGRTSFIIAHRLSTIRNADVILVMKDGDIVETGTHQQLLDQKGFYANLHNSQFATTA